MSCTTFFDGDTFIHRLDPRPRIIVTLAFAAVVAFSSNSGVLCAAHAAGLALPVLARIPAAALRRRLLRLNIFTIVLFITVPPTFPGRTAFTLFSIPFSVEGLLWSLSTAMKANAIVLVFAALIGTIDLFTLGHAFHHLKAPVKLTHLFLFTLRYLDVLHHEYVTLLRAMKARSFRPSMRLHTYRSYAWLTGMLLVRSLERSERILEAMKCRGFRGEFHVLRHFSFSAADAAFSAVSFAVLALFIAAELAGAAALW